MTKYEALKQKANNYKHRISLGIARNINTKEINT